MFGAEHVEGDGVLVVGFEKFLALPFGFVSDLGKFGGFLSDVGFHCLELLTEG